MNSGQGKKRYLVYLASNFDGLDLERYEMGRLLAKQGMLNIGIPCREDAGPYDWDLVRSQIEIADMFILLLGGSYGPMSPTGISHLHREFVHARSLNKPTLAFIKNIPPATNPTEDTRRLAGFHRVIAQQSPYKLWHLREELMTHLRASLASPHLQIGDGWVPAQSVVMSVPAVAPVAAAAEELSPSQRLARSRQLVNLQVTAKVYQGGNLSLEEVLLPARMDQMLIGLTPAFRNGVSESRARKRLETAIAPSIQKQLLKLHPKAHAVDDVKISRGQFHQMLKQWKELGYVRSEGEGSRAIWRSAAS